MLDRMSSSNQRQPVHVLYGGAQLFSAQTFSKIQQIASAQCQTYLPDADALSRVFAIPQPLATLVLERLVHKLQHDPVEDYRIDFEDGYGVRSDADEDAHAEAAGATFAALAASNQLPHTCGIRIRPLRERSAKRALRTLELFAQAARAGGLQRSFVVTLPKVERDIEVDILVQALQNLEHTLFAGEQQLQLELMFESPLALRPGVLRNWVERTGGRCIAVHFGTYDYLSSLDIVASRQSLRHPAAVAARQAAQLELYGSQVRLADGATTLLPVPPHKAPTDEISREQNQAAVHSAYQAHFHNVTAALADGFYQGWDLHPGQLIPRFAATFAFFAAEEAAVRARLLRFKAQAEHAVAVDGVFDDAATVRGLEGFLRRAESSGALNEQQASATRPHSAKDEP